LKEMRRLVRFFNKSTQAAEKLMNIQKRLKPDEKVGLKVVQDVVTRWWSTLAMLDRLFKLKDSLAVYASANAFPEPPRKKGKNGSRGPKGARARIPTEEEWKVLDMMRTVLQPLKVAQEYLEGQKYVTSSLVLFLLNMIHGELVAVTDLSGSELNSSVKKTAKAMLTKFDKIFGDLTMLFNDSAVRGNRNRQVGLNKALLFAHALDPRFKNLDTIDTQHQRRIWIGIEDEMIRLGPLDDSNARETAPSVAVAAAAEETPSASSPNSARLNRYVKILKASRPPQARQRNDAARAWEAKCKQELKEFRQEESVGFDDWKSFKMYNILLWWSEKAAKYPTLWRLAILYFAIPATSAGSERAFSVAGNIVTAKRCRLGADTLEDLHFLHGNLWVLVESGALYFDDAN
jgi:hypothetical protein